MKLTDKQQTVAIWSVRAIAAAAIIAWTWTFAIAQTTQQPLPEITLKVTPPELDVISEGLQTQPFGKVVPLINKLRQQVIDQQPKPVEVPKVEAPK